MQWKKLGPVFCPDETLPWMRTHASTPFPVHIGGDRYRIYFSTRDVHNQSSIASLELELLPQPRVIDVEVAPLISPGVPGLFDDSGVTMSQVIRADEKDYLYYQGWTLASKVPFRCAIGLATRSGGQAVYEKYTQAPVLGINAADPYSLSYPWIRREKGLWRMWYGSTLAWEKDGLDVQHVIKYAESADGIDWQRKNTVCIALKDGESGIVRPCVLYADGKYHMWYSIRVGRKQTYRLGYGVSEDGVRWQRHDEEVNFPIGVGGEWDSEMQCYPCLFEHGGQCYMLYNGNGFGRTGFGLAVKLPG